MVVLQDIILHQFGSKQNLPVVIANVTATGTIDVEVYNNVKSSTITKPTNASKVSYNTDLTGGKINITFADNTTTSVNLSDCTITGFNKTQIGKQTVTAKYTVVHTLSDGKTINEVVKELLNIN